MLKTLVPIACTCALLAGCSSFSEVDRSKVKDDLYQPSPDAGQPPAADGGGDAASAEDAGAEDAG
jgi:hypothetical protein